MGMVKIEFLFGKTFFERLKELVEDAKKRILIASAFLDEEPYLELKKLRADLPIYTIVRDDSRYIPHGDTTIVIPSNLYHGKIYVVDDTLILGSHNLINHSLYNEGEASIAITADSETIDSILFNILYNVFVKSLNVEFSIDRNTTELYFVDNELRCPFCGVLMDIDPYGYVECPMYGDSRARYVYEAECSGYGDEGGCKYCFSDPEIRPPVNRELYLCIDCGLGIDPTHGKFAVHAIQMPSYEYEEKAKRLITLFNGLCLFKQPKLSAKMLHDLDLLGKVDQIVKLD